MQRILSGDGEYFQLGDYNVVNNTWGSDGRTHTQTITIDDDADLASNIHMQWDWGTDAGRVLAYPEISVGYKPWDDLNFVGTSTLSTRILNIKTFDVSHDLTLTGSTDQFNVSYDLWLTNKPLGDEFTITTELMIWAHRPAHVDTGSIVGTYSQKGMTFDIIKYEGFGDPSGQTSASWRYIALVAQQDIPVATIDIQDIFYDLIDRGWVSEKDYITGYELGAEITGGAGGLTINDMSYSLDRYGASNKADALIGTNGRDRIYGLAGADTLSGKGGNDFLSGGKNQDRLTGGNGADVFYFNDLGNKADVISDFGKGADKIALDSQTFSALAQGDLDPDAFKIGRVFDADTHILYNSKTGRLLYDADGSGKADNAHVVALLENHFMLNSSDFEVL